MDPPRTEAAFAAALPLAGLDAWRIYLGLPMCGSRLPAGGQDELMRLGYADAVLKLQGPIAAQGAEEFPAAFAELRDKLDLGAAPLGLLGGSMGSAVAQLVLTETGPSAGVRARAAVLVSPIVQLRPAVDATGRRFGVTYRGDRRHWQLPAGWTSSPVPTSCCRPDSRRSNSSSGPTTTQRGSSNRRRDSGPRSRTATAILPALT
jgi:pimeloyl-ACP methyl ester carboxylesterase